MFIQLSSNANLIFLKNIKRNVVISLIVMLLFLGNLINKIKNTHYFEVNAVVPVTSQGEVVKLYEKSPFKSFRMYSSPYEKFTEMNLLIATNKFNSNAVFGEEVLVFLRNYYKSRDPVIHSPEKENILRKLSGDENLELSNKIENYTFLMRKYSDLIPLITTMRKNAINNNKLINTNIEIEIKMLKQKEASNKIELVKIFEIEDARNSKKAIGIKLILVFIMSLFVSIVVQDLSFSIHENKK